ncbi:MAG: PAS domain-containing protein, partial [Elusimicrobia bacterium]|nr:PAS domain-containing protein [Elusimicrobiota bacterium]
MIGCSSGAESVIPPKPSPEHYLQAIIDNTNLVAHLKNADGRYIYVNRKHEAIARVPKDRIIGRYDRELFPEQIATLFRAQDQEVIDKKKPIEFDETIHLPDGMLSWITAKFPLLDAEGEVWAVGGVCTDITSRKRQPGARAVVVSGYAEEPCMADPRGAGFAAALAKPFG